VAMVVMTHPIQRGMRNRRVIDIITPAIAADGAVVKDIGRASIED
jgi:hypothetical protein